MAWPPNHERAPLNNMKAQLNDLNHGEEAPNQDGAPISCGEWLTNYDGAQLNSEEWPANHEGSPLKSEGGGNAK